MTRQAAGKVLIFGAGNIGRSFIAPVFSEGGYEVVFADISEPILSALKNRSSYVVVNKSDFGDIEHSVQPVRGIDSRDRMALERELLNADYCVTCVGAAVLPGVLKSVASAIGTRSELLTIILAENLKNAKSLAEKIFEEESEKGSRLPDIGIVETSIGKMVPLMPREVAESDPLLVWGESYNTLIADADGFRGRDPNLRHLKTVRPIEAWVDRKLYIHNFGHAAAAYLGYQAHPEAQYLWEILDDPAVESTVVAAMTTAGAALLREYPNVFRIDDILEHIEDLVSRFRNRSLGDTIYRVGHDLRRKLHRQDRVVGALVLVHKHGLDVTQVLQVFTAACHFLPPGPDGCSDPQDAQVLKLCDDSERFLREVVEVDPSTDLGRLLSDALDF